MRMGASQMLEMGLLLSVDQCLLPQGPALMEKSTLPSFFPCPLHTLSMGPWTLTMSPYPLLQSLPPPGCRFGLKPSTVDGMLPIATPSTKCSSNRTH